MLWCLRRCAGSQFSIALGPELTHLSLRYIYFSFFHFLLFPYSFLFFVFLSFYLYFFKKAQKIGSPSLHKDEVRVQANSLSRRGAHLNTQADIYRADFEDKQSAPPHPSLPPNPWSNGMLLNSEATQRSGLAPHQFWLVNRLQSFQLISQTLWWLVDSLTSNNCFNPC